MVYRLVFVLNKKNNNNKLFEIRMDTVFISGISFELKNPSMH
jgi:hypothetical protein